MYVAVVTKALVRLEQKLGDAIGLELVTQEAIGVL